MERPAKYGGFIEIQKEDIRPIPEKYFERAREIIGEPSVTMSNVHIMMFYPDQFHRAVKEVKEKTE